MSNSEPIPEERLLKELDWVRAIARHMVTDAGLAEDVVQETWLVAYRSPPRNREGRGLRRWLARVARSIATRLLRSERARGHREREWAQPEGLTKTPPDLLEQATTQKRLMEAVLELAEPYRSAVLMRFVEELAPDEIARRQGVTPENARQRVSRGLAEVRRRLEEERPGDGRPVHGLLALLGLRRPTSAGWKWGLGLAALGVLGLGLVLALLEGRPTRAVATGVADEVAEGSARAAEPAPGERLPLPPSEPLTPAESAPPQTAGPTWEGRVFDVQGRAVAGLHLAFEPLLREELERFRDRSVGYEGFEELTWPPAGLDLETCRFEFTSLPDGRFVLPRPRVAGRFAVLDEDWTVVVTAAALELPPLGPAWVRVAPRRTAAGRVLGAGGEPLGSARVRLSLPERVIGAETRFPTSLAVEPGVVCAADGRFRFEALPELEDALLVFEAEGYVSAERPLGADAGADWVVVLEQEAAESVLCGSLRDAAGSPIANAVLSLDWTQVARSNEQGDFRMPKTRPSPAPATRASTLRAVARGFQPLQVVLPGSGELDSGLELVLDRPALTLEGVVLRSDGSPHAHASVWLPSPTVLGIPPWPRPPIFAEHIAGGPQEGHSLEATVTDAEGCFRLSGLQDQDYVLAVCDLDTRAWFRSEPSHPSDFAVLEFPPEDCLPRLEGRLVGGNGEPVAGAFVARSSPRLDIRLPDGRGYGTRLIGKKVTTDAHGRFVLEHVPRQGLSLTLLGPTIETAHVALDLRSGTELVVVARQVCGVVVERTGADFDRFTFLDQAERVLDFLDVSTGVTTRVKEALLTSDHSGEYLVTDDARTLVLWAGEREVGRVPIALDAGRQNVLRP